MNIPIALLTDFGIRDHYVGSIKGVIASINPRAVVLDVTHAIRPQNIGEAAFLLAAVYPYLPAKTVCVVVVDPGVGSHRRAICVQTSRGFLVGPDNGVFTHVLLKEPKCVIRQIQNDRYFRKPVSSTFHGRDVFSPVGAHLSRRNIFRSLGPVISNVHMLPVQNPVLKKDKLTGELIYIDHFGNAFSNISKADIGRLRIKSPIRIGRSQSATLVTHFGGGAHGKLIAVWNSIGLLEFALRDGSAENKFKLKVGDPVQLELSPG